jgi:hypothetical protein
VIGCAFPLFHALRFAACLAGLGLASASVADEPPIPGAPTPGALTAPTSSLTLPEAEAVHAAFEAFVTDWLAQLAEDAKEERERNRYAVGVSDLTLGHSYRNIAGEYDIRLKATGREGTPYVGVVRYVEHRYECSASPAEVCEQVDAAEITEIFPFTNGDWKY